MGKIGLSNNQLKIIAMVSMTLDHIGVALFPQNMLLRILGRLAFPIYAFMIAEGCGHTRKPWRYFASMAGLALVCQIVYFVVMGSLYQCILVTFSMSIGLILLGRRAVQKGGFFNWLLLLLSMAAVLFVCQVLPNLLSETDYQVDYGFIGVMMPVLVYFARGKWGKLVTAACVLALLALDSVTVQWYALAALPLLALYNGQRGKWKMKWAFYLYYPAHLVAIQVIAWLL